MTSPVPRPPARRRALLLLAFLVLVVLVVNVAQWLGLARVTRSLEEEAGLRLVTVAAAAVTAATSDLLLAADVAADDWVRAELERVRATHGLESVFLLDAEGVVRLDLDGTGVGRRDPFLELDLAAFAKAAAGSAAASRTLRAGDEIVQAAYAPVEDWDGTVGAVLGVTAGGAFHAQLHAMKRTLGGISLASALLVVVLGAAFALVTRRLSATEAALARSETLSAMGLMAAGVAHEIRNPLAIIAGTADRLRRKYRGGSEDEMLGFIPEEVERLNRIVEGYLRFARDEPLELADCDLVQVAARTARMVESDVAGRGARVEGPGDARPLPVRADPQRLTQVLLNLVLNAVQAGAGRVTLSTSREGADAVVTVADDGEGFGERALKGAFRPFFTTKEKGSGLGLAMAKRIVEDHGGSISVANLPRGGAEVIVRLPAVPAPRREEA